MVVSSSKNELIVRCRNCGEENSDIEGPMSISGRGPRFIQNIGGAIRVTCGCGSSTIWCSSMDKALSEWESIQIMTDMAGAMVSARPTKIVIKETPHGFAIGEFTDSNGESCSIQDSSSALEPKIWIGVHGFKPKIKARDAMRIGREDLLSPPGTPERLNGWVEYPLPDEVSLACRMHLSIDEVKVLIPLLNRFVKTGTIRPRS